MRDYIIDEISYNSKADKKRIVIGELDDLPAA